MKEEVSWHIGKEGGPQERIDTPPHKAYFYWKRNGKTVRSEEYTAEQLAAEIARRKKAGEDTAVFEKALRALL